MELNVCTISRVAGWTNIHLDDASRIRYGKLGLAVLNLMKTIVYLSKFA